MTKPVVTLRNTKGSALNYTELDTNFTNLRDSTINFTDGTNTLSMDLNDTVSIEGEPVHNISVTVNEAGNIIAIDNELSNYTQEPMGFENRIDSTISFTPASREFTIAPAVTAYKVWVKGYMYEKTTTETVTIPNTTGLYYFYFDDAGDLQYKTSFFTLSAEAPIAYVYFNSSIPSAPYLGDERHGITLDWQTHEYLHRTRGAAFATGFVASNYTTAGTGSSDADAQIDIGDGTFYDEDIKVEITHSNTPTANTWQQDLQGPAQIPVIYRLNGAWELTGPYDYPFVNGTSLVTYNLNTAGVWSIPDATSTYFVSYWIVATNNLNYPVISIMGQAQWNKLTDAQDNDTWDSLDLSGFPSLEFRPLYRLIFRTGSAYANTPKAYLADIQDNRLTNILGTVISSGVVGLTEIVLDTSPQLGGDLDVNGFDITAVSGQPITIAGVGSGSIFLTPDTGYVYLDNLRWPAVDGTANQVLKTDGAGSLSWTTTGTINSGSTGCLAYYPSSGTTLDDVAGFTYNSGTNVLTGGGFNGSIYCQLNSQNSDQLLLFTINGNAYNTLNQDADFTYNPSTNLLKVRNIASGVTNGDITISANGTGKIVANHIISSTVAAGTAMIDAYSNATSYAASATLDFANFSGMIIINRQDSGSGNVALWICGSGTTLKLGDSNGDASGTIAANGSINGYTWTNNTGGTITASFAAIRTRTGG